MIHSCKKGLFIACALLVSNGLAAQDLQDKELKKNVAAIEKPLHQLSQLQPRVFEYNKSDFKSLQLPSGKQFGFITEDIQDIFPGLVKMRNVNYPVGKNTTRTARIKTIDTDTLVPLLVASIQEQQAEIEKLKEAIEQLKKIVKP